MSDQLNVSTEYLIDTVDNAKDVIAEEPLLTVITDDTTVLTQCDEDVVNANDAKLEKEAHFGITSSSLHNEVVEEAETTERLTPTTMASTIGVSANATNAIVEAAEVENAMAAELTATTDPTADDEQITDILEQAGVVSEDTVTAVATTDSDPAAVTQESPFEFIHTDQFGNVLTTVSEYSLVLVELFAFSNAATVWCGAVL